MKILSLFCQWSEQFHLSIIINCWLECKEHSLFLWRTQPVAQRCTFRAVQDTKARRKIQRLVNQTTQYPVVWAVVIISRKWTNAALQNKFLASAVYILITGFFFMLFLNLCNSRVASLVCSQTFPYITQDWIFALKDWLYSLIWNYQASSQNRSQLAGQSAKRNTLSHRLLLSRRP